MSLLKDTLKDALLLKHSIKQLQDDIIQRMFDQEDAAIMQGANVPSPSFNSLPGVRRPDATAFGDAYMSFRAEPRIDRRAITCSLDVTMAELTSVPRMRDLMEHVQNRLADRVADLVAQELTSNPAMKDMLLDMLRETIKTTAKPIIEQAVKDELEEKLEEVFG